ncbi:MAG: hypothetical protein JJE22_18530 [Bacteroidia bacterium]|nr:hypothetical protein [Bacteroidia bacterium]
MTQFKEYKIVVGAEGGQKFTDEVNKLISEDWQPTGGVSIILPIKKNLLQVKYFCKFHF